MTKYNLYDDIIALATGIGGAVALIRTTGANSIDKVSKVFSRPKLLSTTNRTAIYGKIIAAGDDGGAKVVDEVVVTAFRAPKSFTGEDMVEISCHGGGVTIDAIKKALLTAGFREAERGEFTLRAFCAGKVDLTRAESIAELVASKTDSERKSALNRLSGALFDTIDKIKKDLIDLIAEVEVATEYPEDKSVALDTDFFELPIEKALAIKKSLLDLSDTWKAESLRQEGVKIALMGHTNAGKSSLFNALLKEDRAIVSPTAGTTRDYLTATLDIGGVPVTIFDTAGLRGNPSKTITEAKTEADTIEMIGIERSLEVGKEADLVLYLIDCQKGEDDFDKKFIAECDKPLIKVFNKSDLGKGDIKIMNAPIVSAKTLDGVADLITLIEKKLKEGLPQKESFVSLGSKRQKILIDCALAALDHAMKVSATTPDGAVEDLQEALDALGEITGDVKSEDILENIFSRFCVGK